MTDIEEQIAHEFRSERFPGTLEGVQARLAARRRIRRAFTAGAILGATAAAMVVFAVVRTPPARPPIVATTPSAVPSPTATAISAAEFDAGCADEWRGFAADRKLPAAFAAQPPIRFDLESGRDHLRIYANEAAAMECSVGSQGKVVSGSMTSVPVGSPLLSQSGRGISMIGSMTFIGSGTDVSGYYLGRTFPGMTDVTAHIPDGQDIPAQVDGDLFLIWQPAGPLTHAVITARSQAATIIDGLISYRSFEDSGVATADAFCRKTITGLVDRHVALLSGVRDAPTILAIKAGSGDHRTWIYRRGLLLVPCHLRADAAGLIGEAILPDAADQWRAGGHVEVMTGVNAAPWAHAFGAAPAGLSSLVLHLPNGRSVSATIKGGVFLAQWQGHAEFQYITATVNGVRYRVATDGTVSRA